jgi:hypothetical protein
MRTPGPSIGHAVPGADEARQRADHGHGLARAVPLDQAVESVLRRQRRVQRAILGSQADAHDPPSGRLGAQRHQIVGEPGHVSAMEAAKAQVHDAGANGRQIIGRPRDVRRQAGQGAPR